MYYIRQKSDNLIQYRFDAEPEFKNHLVKPIKALDIKPETHEAIQINEPPNVWYGGLWAYDGTWTVVDDALYDVAIKQTKTNKCTEINRKRDEMQSLPLEYTFPGGQVGHIQRRNQKDERNIQGMASAGMTLSLEGNTTDKVHFTDQENIKHWMTGSEAMQFGVFVQQNYAANQDNARQHKDAVNALTTIEDVQNYDFSGGWV